MNIAGLVLIIGIVVGGAILAYVVLMIFYPEWVGITGKVALEAERSHKESNSDSEDQKEDEDSSHGN